MKQTASRSEEVIRKHKEYLWPAVTNFYQQPLVADRGSMQYVWDVEGRRYLDFFGGILTISVGHANPRITGPIKAQVDKLQHLSTLYPNEAIVSLAEKAARITPGARLRVRAVLVVPAPPHGERGGAPVSLLWLFWPQAVTTSWPCAPRMRGDH